MSDTAFREAVPHDSVLPDAASGERSLLPAVLLSGSNTPAGVEIVDFSQVNPVRCPCGFSRRGLVEVADFPGSIHQVEISVDARLHYHKRLTETYYILECEPDAQLQLDDAYLPVKPGMMIMIRPGTRHRAVGQMRVLNVVYPKFDPADEWFD